MKTNVLHAIGTLVHLCILDKCCKTGYTHNDRPLSGGKLMYHHCDITPTDTGGNVMHCICTAGIQVIGCTSFNAATCAPLVMSKETCKFEINLFPINLRIPKTLIHISVTKTCSLPTYGQIWSFRYHLNLTIKLLHSICIIAKQTTS